ncbi:hypothetical protein HK096_009178 [Nowakowskiella sp. JEL0078]|nr:hypothetical protein HK096_009178 [Nowakowskiella sp. JEL0078]
MNTLAAIAMRSNKPKIEITTGTTGNEGFISFPAVEIDACDKAVEKLPTDNVSVVEIEIDAAVIVVVNVDVEVEDEGLAWEESIVETFEEEDESDTRLTQPEEEQENPGQQTPTQQHTDTYTGSLRSTFEIFTGVLTVLWLISVGTVIQHKVQSQKWLSNTNCPDFETKNCVILEVSK